MNTLHTINELKAALAHDRESGKTIGFVPTMGALHQGHLSLVERCRTENDICVVSIFVNPTQFNDKNDLKTYPRTLDNDCQLLEPLGCDYVFAPSEQEMYPEPDTRVFNLGKVAEVMEGARRPGHFNGVAQIVSKLFDIVKPDKAYFGEKDFQQIAVIKEMVIQLGLPVNIVSCPIVREADGLAMSSRNTRLTEEQRKAAPAIARVLKDTLFFVPQWKVEEVKSWVPINVEKTHPLRVEYFEIVDAATMQPIYQWEDTDEAVGCIAVFCGDVRLIDNIRYTNLKL